jgi:hypothetical protein
VKGLNPELQANSYPAISREFENQRSAIGRYRVDAGD